MAISTEEMRAREEGVDASAASIAQAIQEVSDRAQILVREEIELAKAEVTEKLTVLIRGAVVGIVAGVFALVGLLFLLHGFAWLSYYLLPVPDQTVFWGFFLVAGVLFLLGGLGGFLAARAFKRGSPPTPELAIAEAKRIQETVKSEHPETTI
jgi:Putative Actinobacterial Holin-X, holin superfamily III